MLLSRSAVRRAPVPPPPLRLGALPVRALSVIASVAARSRRARSRRARSAGRWPRPRGGCRSSTEHDAGWGPLRASALPKSLLKESIVAPEGYNRYRSALPALATNICGGS